MRRLLLTVMCLQTLGHEFLEFLVIIGSVFGSIPHLFTYRYLFCTSLAISEFLLYDFEIPINPLMQLIHEKRNVL